jgi:methionyl-tRNA formyltransferase
VRIVFAGTPDFSVPILQALLSSEHTVIGVYTQPDKASGRGLQVQISPVKECALAHDLPVYQPVSLKIESEQEILKSLQPDLMIVVAYGLILPPAVLAIPSLGCVNVHASLLPRWRGASPIQQAILAGDSETGVSIMQMEAGLDTGPVFSESCCAILPTDTAQTLHDRLSLLGAEALLRVLPDLSQRTSQKQNDEQASYAGKISKKDGLINWNKSAWEISCQVRAFNPWPVAYFYVDGQYVRVWEGIVIDAVGAGLVPARAGTLLKVSAEGLDVAAGDNSIFRITRCQLANGKVLAVKDYLNSARSLFIEGKSFNEC